jgi:predicted transcriptional regulator
MEVLWKNGECCVREVAGGLERRLAYTTVMTTLDRLYKKGLLVRRRRERAFLYTSAIAREEWYRGRAGEFAAGFVSPQHFISCLVDSIGQHDPALLDELEQAIRIWRVQTFSARTCRSLPSIHEAGAA